MDITPPLRFGYADSPFGQLHYAEQGAGRPLLLLHQTPRSWEEFRELIPLLAPHRRVIAMDMVGFGASAKAPAPHTIELLAAGALALLDALDIECADVLGHHTGGVVAVELAASAPERVGLLVLSSTPWTDSRYRRSHADGPGVDEAVHSPGGDHLLTLWRLRQPYYPEPATGLLDRFVHDALAPGVDPAEGHRACARYYMEDKIGSVKTSVLLLGAAADPFALPAMAPLRENLTGALSVTSAVVDGGMIPLMEHKAAEVAGIVTRFLTGTPVEGVS
ncbi:alpha/beta fold hydrolase [Nonomuraea sp. NPDC052129]|uniref:alpha/beta fold hydrolase n=1 Tax=Nonomuraea sp. NPDC052129 TaxID=3154651 RepID=UPI003445967F